MRIHICSDLTTVQLKKSFPDQQLETCVHKSVDVIFFVYFLNKRVRRKTRKDSPYTLEHFHKILFLNKIKYTFIKSNNFFIFTTDGLCRRRY